MCGKDMQGQQKSIRNAETPAILGEILGEIPLQTPPNNLLEGMLAFILFVLKLKTKRQNCATLTPWKTNMEPTTHPCRKEHDLPNLHD